MNLGDMRAIVRRELHDEDDTSYRWSDDELDRHIAHAVKEFSESLPREQKATVATTAGSREVDISSLTGRVRVEAVEYPVGQFPRRYQRFALWGDTLTLLGEEVPAGGNCCIYYGMVHTLDASVSTIPGWLEDLVAVGAEGYAAVEWAAYAVNRVNVGGDKTPPEFLAWGRERLGYFRGELRRLGKRGKVRAGQFYTPARPLTSQTTDYGP